MTMSLVVEHFDDLLATPENAEQLNNAVLQLAIRGKLSPQVKSDEPASELIKRIRNFKGGSTDFSPIKKNEKPFELPDGWEWIRFGDVTINRDGERIPVSKEDRETRDGDFDYYGASGVIDKIDKYLFDKPLLLIGEDGANLINRSTPIAFIAHGKYWVNNHAHVLDAIDFGILKYLEVYINAIDLKLYITGTAQPKMNQAKMNSIVVALPPLAEQQRIVARVEELFAQTRALAKELAHSQSELDGLNKSALSHLLASETPEEFNQHWDFIAVHFDLLFQTPEHVAPLRQSILELAVRGKLTRREAGDEPANKLLKRIKDEKAKLVEEGKPRKEKPPLPIKEVEEPFELPNGWEWVRLKEITIYLQTGPFGSNLHKSDYVPDGIPVVNPVNTRDGKITINQGMLISKSTLKRLSQYILETGDLVLARRGEIGRCALVTERENGWLCGTGSLRLRVSQNICNEYMVLLFKTDFARTRLTDETVGITMSNMSQTALENLTFALPPLAEQERIVKRVEQLLSLCDALEARLQSAEDERGRLVAAVMAGVGS